VETIFTNNPKAGVIQVAEKHDVDFHVILKKDWEAENTVLSLLKSNQVTHIVLAGFLMLIPEWLIRAYPDRIINIHPALLPKYGGKGMYGHHVHQAVKNDGELVSGITIHTIDEHYDQGNILFQHEVQLSMDDNAYDIAARVLVAEHFYYPRVIEKWVLGQPIELP
jgi:phosphoribosylglycinamide formyltransferase-1